MVVCVKYGVTTMEAADSDTERPRLTVMPPGHPGRRPVLTTSLRKPGLTLAHLRHRPIARAWLTCPWLVLG
jgi:hypothetical protein